MTLVEFLLARVAEDEAAVSNDYEWAWQHNVHLAYESSDPVGEWLSSIGEVAETHPAHRARVLAECKAKQRIVEQLTHIEAGVLIVGTNHAEYRSALLFAVRALALPYAAHSDYDQEWRP